jgi:membrane protein involved in colicin uptake
MGIALVKTYPDLAEALQARIRADAEKVVADERRRVEDLEALITALEEAVAKAEALGEQQRHEAEVAATPTRADRPTGLFSLRSAELIQGFLMQDPNLS